MDCIAVINQKGGVGKTATSVNLGAALAQRGQRLLLIDMDPQGHLTTHLGLDGDAENRSIYQVLIGQIPIDEAIHTVSPSIAVVPADIQLAGAETELISVVGREVILRDALRTRTWPYDMILLDCPPSLGVLTLNALCASNRVVIPLQPHFLALQGVGKLFETISVVSQRLNPGLTVLGMALCMHESGTRLAGEVIEDITTFLEESRASDVPWRDARVFQSRIRRNVKLAECPSYGQSIFEYAPRSKGAADYLALADEVLAALRGDPAPADSQAPSTTDDNGREAPDNAGEIQSASAPTVRSPRGTSEPARGNTDRTHGYANDTAPDEPSQHPSIESHSSGIRG